MPVGSGTARATTAELEGGSGSGSLLQANPPSLDYAEDLAALVNLNACSALHTLQQRYRSRLPYTYAGPSLVAIGASRPAGCGSGKVRGALRHPASPVGRGHRPPWGRGGGAPRAVVPADGAVEPSQRGRGAPGGRRGGSGPGRL